jgi:hypothetical protein
MTRPSRASKPVKPTIKVEAEIMATRTETRTTTFSRPFQLVGLDGLQAPGAYLVEIDEETIDELSFVAWRRTATMIHIRRNGTTQVFPVDAAELDACLRRDADAAGAP